MDENTVFALVFLCLMLYGPLLAYILTYGLDTIVDKFVDHMEIRIHKKEGI